MNGNKNIAVDYVGGSYFSVKVTTADGHVVVGDSLKFKYKWKSVKNTVTVKQVLKTSKVTVKKTSKKFTFKATLKIKGKLVKCK